MRVYAKVSESHLVHIISRDPEQYVNIRRLYARATTREPRKASSTGLSTDLSQLPVSLYSVVIGTVHSVDTTATTVGYKTLGAAGLIGAPMPSSRHLRDFIF